eukprot:NODE_8941_length_1458_cov_4.981968.p1 GENE.NODE_8941_length_1458_cov_4.981968~~NODE_8941_length_1458_cov_4.981968.p1  ORF type:complete len:352 (-),score=82.19 NODE_8941_length_1458_cov_4.981968:271-1326(-)
MPAPRRSPPTDLRTIIVPPPEQADEMCMQSAISRSRHGHTETKELSRRYLAPSLVAVGSIIGILGFAVALGIGLYDFWHKRTNFRGEAYSSGLGYLPATLSELVHDWQRPSGRIFFGCGLLTSILYMMSWYPFELRNAYTGSDRLDCLCGRPYLITFRQIMPVLGLMLLICVSSVPVAEAHGMDFLMIVVHLTGATMLFVGYSICEAKSIQVLHLSHSEKWARILLLVAVSVNFLAFCVLQVVMHMLSTDDLCCCHDVYVSPHVPSGDLQQRRINFVHKMILDTASGPFFLLKIASFVTEVFAGLALFGSHLVIYHYCEERHIDFGHFELKAVYSETRHLSLESGVSADQD